MSSYTDNNYKLVLLTFEYKSLYSCQCGQVHVVDVDRDFTRMLKIKIEFVHNKWKGLCVINCKEFPQFILITKIHEKHRLIMPYINWMQKSGYDYPFEDLTGDIKSKYIIIYDYISFPCKYRYDINNAFTFQTTEHDKIIMVIQKIIEVSKGNILNFYNYCANDIHKYTSPIIDNPQPLGVDNFIHTPVNIIKQTQIGLFLSNLFNEDCKLKYKPIIANTVTENFIKEPELIIKISNYVIDLNYKKFVIVSFIVDDAFPVHLLTIKNTNKEWVTHVDIIESKPAD